MERSARKIGSYRIVRLVGSGGMGKVYEATRSDGSSIALKAFDSDHVKSRFLRERFEVEGRILAKLRHPRLVTVYESGVDERTGNPYYAMAFVCDSHGRSTTLHDVCGQGKVTEARAERWYRDLCDVLTYCHSQGVVHRDVKLGNVLLDAEDHAILADFGVSRIVESDLREELKLGTTFVTGETAGTRPVMGSYWYLAPEVRRGEAATFESDWYALGVLFFRLLTGMWYEPGTDAMELLAPYDPIWRKRLEVLLSEDPSGRARSPAAPRDGQGLTALPIMGLSMVALLLGTGLCLFLWHTGRVGSLSRPQTRLIAAASSRPPYQTISLAFDATNRFAFCPCPPGTNSYRNLSISVTLPYWLGATPVTRRQYFAVMDEPLTAWEGGEDAPMTYLSRDEVTNFCARLNRRFVNELPAGCEIRLPTLAEWRLAYVRGKTVPSEFADKMSMRRAYAERGWFGQGVNGEPKNADMRRHYESLNRPIPLVTNIWADFPPRVINPGKENWMRNSSQIAPVPVGKKPANDLGLYDMLGNCFERVFDTCSTNVHHWGRTEWGVTTIGLYAGQGLALANPVERTGDLPLMVGSYLAPDLDGDRVWSADFDCLPHLGLRLCIGPKISKNETSSIFHSSPKLVDAIVPIASDEDGQIPSDAFETNASTGIVALMLGSQLILSASPCFRLGTKGRNGRPGVQIDLLLQTRNAMCIVEPERVEHGIEDRRRHAFRFAEALRVARDERDEDFLPRRLAVHPDCRACQLLVV